MPSELPGFSRCRPIPAGIGPALTTRGDRFFNLVESLARLLGAAPQADVMPAARWAIARRRATREDRAADPRWLGDAYLRTRGGGSRLLAARRGS